MFFRSFLTAVAFFALALPSASQAATLVFTDDFSAPFGGTSFVTYYSGGSPMGNWSVDRGSVDLIGGYWQAPSVGGGSVDLDGSSPGSISQILTLSPGSYMLSFSLSGNPEAGALLKSVGVSIGDASEIFSYNTRDNGTTKTDMHYINEVLFFSISPLASQQERRLSFISQSSSGAGGAVIGNLQISQVPLPAALPLFGAALLGIGAVARRRKISR